MRLLLDENLPKRLRQDLAEHEVFTVADKGWTGVSNGKLLTLLTENNFQALPEGGTKRVRSRHESGTKRVRSRHEVSMKQAQSEYEGAQTQQIILT
jgi:hypothetical protein